MTMAGGLMDVLRVGAIATIAVALSAGLTPGNRPEEPPGPAVIAPTSRVAPPTVAQNQDTRALAEALGVSVGDAAAMVRGQEEFSALVAELERDFPDTFVAAAWEPSSQVRGWVEFSGAVPEAVPERVARAGNAVELRTGTRVPAAILSAATEEAYFAVYNLPSTLNAVAFAEPGEPHIEIAIETVPTTESSRLGTDGSADDTGAADAIAERALEVDEVVGASNWTFDVTVTQATAIGEPEFRGGLFYGGGCTAAFTVISGSTTGISTAEHCGADSSYDGASFVTQFVLAPQTGDARWSRNTSGSASSQFQYTRYNFRNAVSGINPAVGTGICKFGYATGNTCDTVWRTGICANGYCGLYAVDEWISDNGDSGGPWFWGSGAKGIHHGRASIDGATRSLFTRIGAVNLMNAVVYTG